MAAAKDQLDELLMDQNLKIVHTDATVTEQDNLIPDYLVNLLVYFLIVSSKYSFPLVS